MVVNRKQPVAPVPLVQSRTTSQQPIATRKKHSKHTTSNGIDPHKPEHVPSTNLNSKQNSTSRVRPRKKSQSLRDKLFVWSLSLFVLYSFFVCSSYTTTPQKSQSHFICRAETDYKTYILDPIILPPLKYTLSFTHSLAEPYISQANNHLEPYLAPVTSTVKPYIIQTATVTKRIWEATLIPLYKNTLKPYYQSAILPRYNLYLRLYFSPLVNHLERYYAYYVSNPIRIQANRIKLHLSTLYVTRIHSYIGHLRPHIHRFTSTVHTTWLSSFYLYGTYIQHALQSTWIQAQPHLSFAFDQAKDTSLNAAAGTAKHLKGLAKQVGTQRRAYVDPHIRKIWDKVEENATAKTPMATPTAVDISEEETAESTIVTSITTDEATTHITNTKESDTLPVDPGQDTQDVLYPTESTPPPLDSASPSLPHSTSTQKVQSAVSIVEASTHDARRVLYESERAVETLVGNAVDATIFATVEDSEPQAEVKLDKEETPKELVAPATQQVPEVISTQLLPKVSIGRPMSSPSTSTAAGVMGVGASSPPSDSTEDDLDDFLRDIGLDTSSSSPSPSPSPTPTQLSEADEGAASVSAQEAEASRLASVASKRLAITTRHAAFESDLQTSIVTSTSQIIKKLNEMREAKKEELTRMIEGTSEGEGETGFVAQLTLNGDKLMKGLDVYLKKCEGRSGTWKQRGVTGNGNESEGDEDIQKRTGIAKDEQARLESVIEKVEIKFLDVVQKLQEQVHGWYSGMIEKELEEISQVATKIKVMAEQAQANIGMDYAWLEDVTYMDWQRYHDLARASDKFGQTANAIQNGTSVDPLSPPNPVKPVINALQEELQTVILGFYVALGSVRNTIPELFSIYESVPVPERDDSIGVGEEDEVRIQPIDPDIGGEKEEKASQNEEGFDASKVIIGKSKEQIEQALGDVPLVVKHEEL